MQPLPDLNALDLADLWRTIVDPGRLTTLFELARDEDLGERGDITSQVTVGDREQARAALRARRAGVLAGLAAVPTLLQVFGSDLRWTPEGADGDALERGQVVGTLNGRRRDLLALERTLLNLLSRCSGVASLTRNYVDAVAGTDAVICDTRKTLPGWRDLDKFAVRCGGATLHRLGLHDAMLVKDNHVARLAPGAMAERLEAAVARARADRPLRFVEVEVDELDQLDALLLLPAGTIDVVLLDNMSPDRLREAVRRRDASSSRPLLEASGGIDLTTIRAVAETGVERISVGAVTHSATALDLGLDATNGT